MNKKVVIDAGHGGDDPGTIANNIVEKDYTLAISKYIKNRLDDFGIENSLTRDSDLTLGPDARPRVAQGFYGNGDDVILISNHINAGGGDGAEVIYPLRSDDILPNMILDEMKKKGQNIRKSYQRRLPSDPSKDYYFMQRNTGDTQSLTVEYGFLDSTKDDVSQLKNNYKNLADAVYDAVLKYIGYEDNSVLDTYIVKKGDTLYSIALKNGISVDTLKSLNNLTNDTLSIGQILTLKPTMSNELEYIVKKGDTLYSIAKNNGTDVNTLKALNNLDNNIVFIGQTIKLPSSYKEPEINVPSNGYIVKNGDTLYSIALKNGVTVKELLDANDLDNNILSIGQTIIIPNKINYVVEKGDTLYGISKKFNTTVDKLKKDNNLNSNTLSVGQILIV